MHDHRRVCADSIASGRIRSAWRHHHSGRALIDVTPDQETGLPSPSALPPGARAVVLLVHPDCADGARTGQRFIADVLAANGLATLSITLAPAAGAAQAAEQLRRVTDQLEGNGATRGLPVVLVGVHGAAAVCAEAMSRVDLATVQGCVWLDGHVDLGAERVASWRLPTLCLAGRHGSGAAVQPLRGIRRLPAPHRLVKLQQRSLPAPSAGVHEAMACELLAWLRKTVPERVAA
jgi:hypothetical protein